MSSEFPHDPFPPDDCTEGEPAPAVRPVPVVKGRGTGWREPHRFESSQREAWDDGWGTLDPQVHTVDDTAADVPGASILTEVREERAGQILAQNDSPDLPFELSINPYRGCEHVMWNSLEWA